MGKLIKTLAENRGHEIVAVIDDAYSTADAETVAALLKGADAAIDFTIADAVERNLKASLLAGVPLVEGTTGWNARREEFEALVRASDGAFVFGANFSVGVNLFYRVVDFAAALFAKFDDYETFVEERHHSRKKDAPSGTALKLKDIVAKHYEDEFSVAATRAGSIPGTHTVGFDAAPDTVELTHTARSREGFALGAIVAAEWIAGKKGFYEFTEVMDEVVKG